MKMSYTRFGIFSRAMFLSLLMLVLMVMPGYSEIVKSQNSEAELISEGESIQPGQPFWVALRLKADDDWHTYWINPGDSGLATSIKWELPEGFQAEAIQWPYPERIEAPPLVSFGYDGEIYLLIKITPPANFKGDKAKLVANAKWLVCKEACLPASAKLNLEIPVKNESPKPDAKWASVFADTRAKQPVTATDWNINASLAGKDTLIVNVIPPAGFKGDITKGTFFPLKAEVIDYAAPQVWKKDGPGYRLELKRAADTEAPTKLEGILVSSVPLKDGGREKALNVDVAIGAATNAVPSGGTVANATPKPPAGLNSLLYAILFSFIGGLILNLMPCVLPVLSIKVLDFVKKASDDKAKTWQHGLVFTLGVLVSFWTLAGALIALKASGEKLGWGFQLQSPTFLIILSTIFFLFGLNLFGVFEVGTSLMGVGSNAVNSSGWFGSFASGALATMVATPCTAPFMGSALGFALTQPLWASMLIFTSLGLGMSSPYILLSFSPSLLKFVPKPGAWMETFKQFMGFLLMATVVWLGWVLGHQAGVDAVVGLMMALVIMGMGGWVLGRWGSLINTNRTRLIAQVITVLLIFAGAGFAVMTAKDGAPEGTTIKNGEGIAWQQFSPKMVEDMRAAGKPVFIDFTATWCLSCQVNERVTFRSKEVQDQFKKLGIVPLKADWTSRDETITKTLEGFGRSGVPLYVLYNPKESEPKILPEVITPSIILEEFKKLEKTTDISQN